MFHLTALERTRKMEGEGVTENELRDPQAVNTTGEISTGNKLDENQQAILDEIQNAFDLNVDAASEIRFSRVAIMQPLSPEIANEEPGYKQGMLVDNITREILSDYSKPQWLIDKKVPEEELDPLHNMLIIPVMKLPSEFVRWIPRTEQKERGDGKQIEWKSTDRSDPRVREGVWPGQGGTWGTKPEQKNVAPPVTENSNFLCVVVDPETGLGKTNFIVLTFSRTSFQTGSKLTTSIAGHKMQGLPPFGVTYYIYTKKEVNDSGTYFVTHMAKGRRTQEVAPKLIPLVRGMALYLSGDQGRDRQLQLINAAQLEDSEHSSNQGGGESSDALDPEDDPFSSEDSSEEEDF